MKTNNAEVITEMLIDRAAMEKLWSMMNELCEKAERYSYMSKSGRDEDILIAITELNSVNYDILETIESVKLHRSALEQLLQEQAKEIISGTK